MARWAKEASDREKEKEGDKSSGDAESSASIGKKGKNKKVKEAVKVAGVEKVSVGDAVEPSTDTNKDKEKKKETKGQRFRRIENERQAKRDAIREEEGDAVDELQALCESQSMHKVHTCRLDRTPIG